MPANSRKTAHSNAVGYVSQPSIAGFNYVTPTFVAVDGESLLTAQDIQVPADLAAADANIQVLDSEGLAPKMYNWYPTSYFEVDVAGKAFTDDTYTKAFTLPAGKNGVWAEEHNNGMKGKNIKYWYEVLDKEFAPADAVQVWTKDADVPMTTAGAVPDENVVVYSIAGFNYVGNPFPAAITTQNIEVPADVAAADANIQVLDSEGLAPKMYNWYPASYFEVDVAGKAYTDDTYTKAFTLPEGAKGVWAEEHNNGMKGKNIKYWYEVLNKELKPGESIQLWTKDAEVEITILCPYDLKADK